MSSWLTFRGGSTRRLTCHDKNCSNLCVGYLVLPAAVVGGFVARFLGGMVGRVAVVGAAGTESNVVFALQLLVYALAAAAFVLVGTFTAPRYRRITAVVLAIVATLLSLFTHVLSQNHPGSVNFSHLAAETVGACLAVVYVSLAARLGTSGQWLIAGFIFVEGRGPRGRKRPLAALFFRGRADVVQHFFPAFAHVLLRARVRSGRRPGG